MSFRKVINLTGATVCVVSGKNAHGKYVKHATYRAGSGLAARIDDVPTDAVGTVITPEGVIPVASSMRESSIKQLVDLPAPEDGVMLIVNFGVAQKMATSGRTDLYFPSSYVPSFQIEDPDAGVHYCHRLIFVRPGATDCF